jgi:hypothetical protein
MEASSETTECIYPCPACNGETEIVWFTSRPHIDGPNWALCERCKTRQPITGNEVSWPFDEPPDQDAARRRVEGYAICSTEGTRP